MARVSHQNRKKWTRFTTVLGLPLLLLVFFQDAKNKLYI